MQLKSIILASGSPRRKALLEQARIPFTVNPMDIDESFPPDMPVHDVAEYLAIKKAKAAWTHLGRGPILTADSVVIANDEILGKPSSREEAISMLEILQGGAHEVMTGICLATESGFQSDCDLTIVYLDAMTREEIGYYVDQYEPYDKAGSYAIQEWIGWCKVGRIEGSYANVMGLPVHLVYRLLASV